MKLTEEQKKEIVELYRSGKSSTEIGKIYNRNFSSILDILHNSGESVRDPRRCKLNEEQKTKCIELYRYGKTFKEIAKQYDVSPSTINNVLSRSGEVKRKGGNRAKVFSEKEIKDIIKLYRHGKSSEQIGKKYCVSHSVIINALRNVAEQIRHGSIGNEVSEKEQKEIVALYKKGLTIRKIESMVNISWYYINMVLREKGIEIKKGKFSDVQRNEIVDLYRSAKTAQEIAKIYCVSRTAVTKCLKDKGELIREHGWIAQLSELNKKDIIELYRSGKSTTEIAVLYKVSNSSIRRLLKLNKEKLKISPKKVEIINSTCICRRCNRVKPVSEMRKDKNTLTGITRICNECSREAHKISNVPYKQYGITRKDYEDMLKKQDGKCAICGCDTGGTSRSGGIKRLSIDHSHYDGKIRGLLCNMCNVGIGNLRDDPELLEKAAQYLRSYT